MMEIETLDCPTCPICRLPGPVLHGSVTDRAHNVPGTWSFRSCDRCRVGWLDPQPTDREIGRCYPSIYYTHEAGSLRRRNAFDTPGWKGLIRDAVFAGRYQYQVPRVGARMRRIGRLLGAVPPVRRRLIYSDDSSLPIWQAGGKLLDIGCGAGNYLNLAASLGWTTFGLDPDPAAAESAARSGATVTVGTLETARFPDAPFDAVTSMHSIEHSRDPRRFLQQATSLLRPGGFFYIQSPNFGSLMHRRYKADWYALETSRHLCMLTVPGMRRLVEEMGPWRSLTVRSIPRRAVREQEQTIAMRRTGSFENSVSLSGLDRFGVAAWALLERLGNRTMSWGEEIEVIGIKASRSS